MFSCTNPKPNKEINNVNKFFIFIDKLLNNINLGRVKVGETKFVLSEATFNHVA